MILPPFSIPWTDTRVDGDTELITAVNSFIAQGLVCPKLPVIEKKTFVIVRIGHGRRSLDTRRHPAAARARQRIRRKLDPVL